MTHVAVIVPTRDNLAQLKECLESLLAQTRAPTVICVCVDGSSDGTLEYLDDHVGKHPIEIVSLMHPGNANRGRAATRNLALDRVVEGYTWFVDSDMVLAPDALEQHLLVADGRAATSVGAVAYTNADEAAWARYLNTRGRHKSPDGAILPFTQFTTANSLVSADSYRELGGFDERFTGYGGEDLEFAYRLERQSGRPFINNKRAVARTVEEKTIGQAIAQFQEYGAGNLHLLEQLHPGLPRTFQLQRLDSTRLVDRLFVASVNPVVERLVDVLVGLGPPGLRNHLLNYKVISAVWRGFRSASARPAAPTIGDA